MGKAGEQITLQCLCIYVYFLNELGLFSFFHFEMRIKPILLHITHCILKGKKLKKFEFSNAQIKKNGVNQKKKNLGTSLVKILRYIFFKMEDFEVALQVWANGVGN